MSGDKNLFEILTYNKSSGEFYSLWKIISDKFTFNKIPLNNTNNTNEEANKNNNNNKKNKINETRISNEIVIYHNDEYKIVSNKQWDYGNIFAVQDRSQLNRYFISFTYDLRYTDYNICGMIVYFDSTGKVGEKNILNDVVCTYDARNGLIDTSKTLFYKQSLLFYQVHRDTKQLTLFVNLLNHYDNLQDKSTKYTDIKTDYLPDKAKYDYPRFFHITEIL
jgi:hypothetical protein